MCKYFHFICNFFNKKNLGDHMTYNFTIPGTPVPQPRPRFTRSPRQVYNPSFHAKNCAAILLRTLFKQKPIAEQPISINITFFMPIPKAKHKHNLQLTPHTSRPDIDNLIKFILDACNNIIYSDDALISKLTAQKLYDDNPRTEFIVEIV